MSGPLGVRNPGWREKLLRIATILLDSVAGSYLVYLPTDTNLSHDAGIDKFGPSSEKPRRKLLHVRTEKKRISG